MDPRTPAPEDERHHEPDGDPLWNESYAFEFATAAGDLGGYVRIGRYPASGVAWYWACVVGPDRSLVTVVDHEVDLPPRPSSLEIRADGLWADHNVETPFDHMSLGLEAFGLAHDDPGAVYRDAYGDRTPMAFDLEWERDGEVVALPDPRARYEVPCRVHGEILVGHETIELDGFGQRSHGWGRLDWWAGAWCRVAFRADDGARILAAASRRPGDRGAGSITEPGAPGRSTTAPVTSLVVDEVIGADDIPIAALVVIDGRSFEVEPIAWAPVLLTAPDGRDARLARGLARFTERTGAHAGRRGVGWIDLVQPLA